MTTDLMQWLAEGGQPEALRGFHLLRDRLVDIALQGPTDPVEADAYRRWNLADGVPAAWAAMPEQWHLFVQFEADLSDDASREAFLAALMPGTREALAAEVEAVSRPARLEVVAFDSAAACDVCASRVEAGADVVRLESRTEGDRYIESCVVVCMACVGRAASGVGEVAQ